MEAIEAVAGEDLLVKLLLERLNLNSLPFRLLLPLFSFSSHRKYKYISLKRHDKTYEGNGARIRGIMHTFKWRKFRLSVTNVHCYDWVFVEDLRCREMRWTFSFSSRFSTLLTAYLLNLSRRSRICFAIRSTTMTTRSAVSIKARTEHLSVPLVCVQEK